MGNRLLAVLTIEIAQGKPGFGKLGFLDLHLDVMGEDLLGLHVFLGQKIALHAAPLRVRTLGLRTSQGGLLLGFAGARTILRLDIRGGDVVLHVGFSLPASCLKQRASRGSRQSILGRRRPA